MYRPILLAVATLGSLAAGSMVAQGRDAPAPVVARAVAAPVETRPHVGDAMNDALAAAVIGSISRQFDTADVTVQLGNVDVLPTSERDRELRGAGRLRIGGDPQWIDFRFAALYDTQALEVTLPRLQLGAAPVRSAGAADAGLARSLQAHVAQALGEEFSGQPVSWTQATTSVAPGGARFAHVRGSGVADFGVEGRVGASVDALYDRRTGRWLRVDYALGESPEQAGAML